MATPAPKPALTDDQLKAYSAKCNVLLVEAGGSASKSIRKFLMQMGTKAELIESVERYQDAEKLLKAKPFLFLVVDLKLGEQSGLDLVRLQEAHFKNRLEATTLLLCSDPSQVEIGMIIDSNIDATLVKPFNMQNLKESIILAFENKVLPSEGLKKIEEGKAFITDLKLDEALVCFQAAAQKDPKKKPLAQYYQGFVLQKMKKYSEATEAYKVGLSVDPKDYRCLTGALDCQIETKLWKEAYESAANLHKNYPVSPVKIPDLIKLSLLNSKYEDLNSYLEIFKKLQVKSAILCKSIIAGSLLCSKYFHQQKTADKVTEFLDTAIRISNDTKALRPDVFRYCIETQNWQKAEKFMMEFDGETKRRPDMQLLALEVTEALRSASEVVKEGMSLKQEGVHSARLFELLIRRSRELKRSASIIDELVGEAQQLYPDHKFE